MAIILKKLLPLNWHYLSLCSPLLIGKTCFITGRNTSGKSTIVDALRLLFFVSTKKFNAANALSDSRDKRDLASYVRGKIDVSDGSFENGAVYLREGQTITHIVAELYSEENGVSFVIGVCVEADALVDSTSLSPKWWMCENCTLDDFQFVIELENGEKRFAKLNELRQSIRGSTMHIFNNQYETKLKFSKLFGLTDEIAGSVAAFDNWVETQNNAIAFNPKSMKNVDDFIKNLVIPKKEILTKDFDALLEQHEILDRTMSRLKEQHASLKEIVDMCTQYASMSKQQRVWAVVCDIADSELLENTIKELDVQCDALELQIAANEGERQRVSALIDSYKDALRALENDPNHQAVRPLINRLNALEQQIHLYRECSKSFQLLLEHVNALADSARTCLGAPVVDTAFISHAHGDVVATSPVDLNVLFSEMINSIRNVQGLLLEEQVNAKARVRALDDSIQALSRELNALAEGSGFDFRAVAVKEAIQRRFNEMGYSAEPKFLCELLEFTDTSWADAGEAFMAGYRFSIIVLPEYYATAAAAYKEFALSNPNIFNVTLVDTTAFVGESYVVPEDSLAAILRSSNPYAKAYVDYSYNHVRLADDVACPPDKTGTYISKDRMRYSNRAYSRMRPVKFLALGAQARENRKKQCEADIEHLRRERTELWNFIHLLDGSIRLAQSTKTSDLIAKGWEFFEKRQELPCLLSEQDELSAKIKQMHNDDFDRQMKVLKQNLSDSTKQLEVLDRKTLPDLRSNLNLKVKELNDSQNRLNDCEERLIDWQRVDSVLYTEAAEALATARAANKRKGLNTHRMDFEEKIESAKLEANNLNHEIKRLQKEYNVEFGSDYLCEGYSSADDFRDSFHQLDSFEIPEIHLQLSVVSGKLQYMFEENILAQLRVCIEDADATLKQINKVMDKVNYNGLSYHFARISPAKGMEEYFDMITDKNNVDFHGGQFSFESLAFNGEHSDLRKKLVGHIKDMSRNGKGSIDWLDYRTYCSFTINVHDAIDESRKNKLSAIVSVGSGSEVQIPFYVILASALVQRYNVSNRMKKDIHNSKSLRLMLIDECFDKMDYDNVQTMLNFLCEMLGIQLIASAPTDKFSTVGVQMDSIVFMKTDKALRQRDCYCFTPLEVKRLIDEGVIEVEPESDNDSSG